MGGGIDEFHDRVTKKKLRNRLSAQRARDRQKARMHLLEMEVQYLMRKNISLMRENEMIRRSLANKVINTTRTLHGVGLSRSRAGRNIICCCQSHGNRARNDSVNISSTKEKSEACPPGDIDKHRQNANYAIQPFGPLFHGHYLPGNSIPLTPSEVIQIMRPWDRLTSLSIPADGGFQNSMGKGDKKPEQIRKVDTLERESDCGDDEKYQYFPKRPRMLASLEDDSSYTESSDDDSDGTDEEDSTDF